MSVPAKPTYPQLTSTRFLAAFLVVVYHFGILPRQVVPFVWFDKINFFNQAGSCSVYYFFVLSGFVLTAAYRNKTIEYGTFVLNRLGRIYPAFLLGLLLIVLIIVIPTHLISDFIQTPALSTAKQIIKITAINTSQLDRFSLILNFLLLHSWNVATWQTFNGPGWSLSVEFFLYLCFPFLLSSLSNIKTKTAVVSLIIIASLSVGCTILIQPAVTDSSRGYFFFGSPLLALPSFLMGMLTFELSARNKFSTFSINPLLPLCISVGICVILICIFADVDFFLTPFFAVIIWSLAHDRSSLSVFLSRPKLVFLGEISYGYYILQVPVFLVAQRWFHLFDNRSDNYLFYTLNALLMAVAWVSFRWLETPIRKRVNAYTARLVRVDRVSLVSQPETASTQRSSIQY